MGMDPISWVMMGSAALSAIGAGQKAGQQRDALNYQASVSERNAQVAQYNASDTIRTGQAAENDQQLKTASVYGAQRAALAANGVDLGEGSPNAVLATTKFMGDRDTTRIHNEAIKRAWGYSMQEQAFMDEANQFRSGAGSISPFMAIGTSLLGSATNFASNNYAKTKVGG